MAKLYCVRDLYCFRFGVNSSLAAIMVERNTGAEIIAYYVIPGFASAGCAVYDDWDP